MSLTETPLAHRSFSIHFLTTWIHNITSLQLYWWIQNLAWIGFFLFCFLYFPHYLQMSSIITFPHILSAHMSQNLSKGYILINQLSSAKVYIQPSICLLSYNMLRCLLCETEKFAKDMARNPLCSRTTQIYKLIYLKCLYNWIPDE